MPGWDDRSFWAMRPARRLSLRTPGSAPACCKPRSMQANIAAMMASRRESTSPGGRSAHSLARCTSAIDNPVAEH